MLDTAIFKVTKEIAVRSGLINVRYRTQDGHYILDSKDLSRVRIRSNEYLTGIQGIEKISKETARRLIEQNGYSMGEASIARSINPTPTVETPKEEKVFIEEPVEAQEEASETTQEEIQEETQEEVQEETNTEEE